MASGEKRLPNGVVLTWRDNPDSIGRTYYMPWAGGEIVVWNTAVVDQRTLRACLAIEDYLFYTTTMEKEDGSNHS